MTLLLGSKCITAPRFVSENQVQRIETKFKSESISSFAVLTNSLICTHSCGLSSLFSKSIKDNAKASGNFPGTRTEVSVQQPRDRIPGPNAAAYLGPQTSLLIFGRTLSSKIPISTFLWEKTGPLSPPCPF